MNLLKLVFITEGLTQLSWNFKVNIRNGYNIYIKFSPEFQVRIKELTMYKN